METEPEEGVKRVGGETLRGPMGLKGCSLASEGFGSPDV